MYAATENRRQLTEIGVLLGIVILCGPVILYIANPIAPVFAVPVGLAIYLVGTRLWSRIVARRPAVKMRRVYHVTPDVAAAAIRASGRINPGGWLTNLGPGVYVASDPVIKREHCISVSLWPTFARYTPMVDLRVIDIDVVQPDRLVPSANGMWVVRDAIILNPLTNRFEI